MLTTLAQAARKSGLRVVELDGWRTRNSNGGEDYKGVLVHHTGSYDSITDAKNDLDYARWLASTGRPEDNLPPPLANLALSAEGVVYVLAAGNANHAGQAKASGPMPAAPDGSRIYIGIEAMNSGSQGWRSKGKDADGNEITQYTAYVRLCAALCLHYDWPASHVRAHKETSVTGKWDPGLLEMEKFRSDIAAEIKRRQEPKVPTTFKAITWNVYAGSSPDALEPHLIRERDAGVSLMLMQEAGAKRLPEMVRDNGLEFFAHEQWAIAWSPKVWPKRLDARGVRLTERTYYHFGKKEQIANECAVVLLEDRAGRSLTALSYHTPAKVQSREGEPERVKERIAVTFEAHRRIGSIARGSSTTGFLAGGDDNWDEDTGFQNPIRKVRRILLGATTGLRQLQAGEPTFGKREIDDFRIPRRGKLKPVGDPWVHEGGGEEKPNHKIHGRRFEWKV